MRSKESRIINAFADWIAPFPWQWFMTMTFAKRMHPATAKKLFIIFLTRFNNDASYVFVIEEAKCRRTPVHIHSLASNLNGFNPNKASALWQKRYGINKIEPYNRELGARYYMGKYLAQDVDWDIEMPRGM